MSLLVGIMLISCSKDEPGASGYEMKFSATIPTRVVSTTESSITDAPFAIFGDMIPSLIADKPSARTIIFNNEQVTYIGSEWSTVTTQYWYPGHLHSFVAIHPASVLSSDDAVHQYIGSQLSFRYIPPSGYKQLSDVLVATHCRNFTLGTVGTVPMKFGHVMSLINVMPVLNETLMDESIFIKIHKVELAGCKDNALFTIKPASLQTSDQTDDNIISITEQKGKGKSTVEFDDPIIVFNNNEYVSLFSENDGFIVLPQKFSTDSDARIVVTYSINNTGRLRQNVIPLQGNECRSGKAYDVKFQIDMSAFDISSSIVAWIEKEFTVDALIE